MRCARPFEGLFHKPHPKSKFTAAEDELLGQVVEDLGTDDWQLIARQLPGRNARQCRDRWLNYLSPDVGNGPWTPAEEEMLVEKYREFGAAWKHIASFFRSRTDINVKSRWQLMQRRVRKNSAKQMVRNAAQPLAAPPPRRPLPMVPRPLPMPIVSCAPLPFTTARPPQVATPEPEAADGTMDQIWGSLMMNEETPFGRGFDLWF
jgi:hypothetical protein